MALFIYFNESPKARYITPVHQAAKNTIDNETWISRPAEKKGKQVLLLFFDLV